MSKESKTYEVQVTVNGGRKWISLIGFPTKKGAEDAAAKRQAIALANGATTTTYRVK